MNQETIETSSQNPDREGSCHKTQSSDNGKSYKPKSHKKIIAIVSLAMIALVVLIITIIIIHDIEETKRLDATSVTLSPDLTINFDEPAQISSFISDLQGSLVDDFEIRTDTLGEQEITFEYINARNKKRSYTFKINVIDDIAPTIYGGNSYSVPLNYEGDLTNLMFSGDNLDDHPKRQIIGDYNLSKIGSYEVEYTITDASGNESRQPFVLNVIQPVASGTSSSTSSLPDFPISEAISEYKTQKTKIGIDVSSWQGSINWQEVKASGVEFAFIRIGYQVDYGGEYVLDKYFAQNIEGATAAGLPIGIYFYSYANNINEAEKQAKWIIEHLGDYQVKLGVAFDWEDWGDFNSAGMSFHTINRVAQTFLDTLADSGYKGLLYGSLNYLRRIWRPEKYLANHEVWLAQYYSEPTYEKPFRFWQLSNTGLVPGINAYVDLDIMYLE